jgi:exodeoxyribonuclease VII small subunit
MSKSEPRSVETMNYEQAFAELEQIVTALESGSLSLDESLVRFERGQALAAHCAALLQKAQLKVKSLAEADVPTPAEPE